MRRLTRITAAPLAPDALSRAVLTPKRGALTAFTGVVRSVHAGRRVRAVSYDCFVPLAERTLAAIAREAGRRWPVTVAAAHRTGRLRVGQASVAIAVGSTHRDEGFAACRFVIEEIKTRLPVWKKEHYASGDGRWLAGCALGRRH
jgi:molybdopterin synthase catalytic subunit